jgi:hypothetical protein
MSVVNRLTRTSGKILALIVAITTLAIVSNAVQTISTPNASSVAYNLAPGANSPDITVSANTPVLVSAICTTVGRRGVTQVTMHRTSLAPLFLQCVGLSSPAGPTVVSDWWPGGGSAHISWVDFAHQVELRVVSAGTFDVQSLIPAGGPAATGSVKLIW